MLSLILISLKQNASLLIEAQLKHGASKRQGLAAPSWHQLQLEAWRAAGQPIQPFPASVLGWTWPWIHRQGQGLPACLCTCPPALHHS